MRSFPISRRVFPLAWACLALSATGRAEAPAASAPAAAAAPAPPSGSSGPSQDDWNEPYPPYHLLGNIQYVGRHGVSAFLITTPAGSILLDGGLEESAVPIQKSITELGFKVSDIEFLLNSHAHFDHAGGLAALKKASGAKLVASRGDAPRLRAGADRQPAEAVDRVVDDGGTVELGGTVLTAHVTPGHTPGCTTWTMTTTEAGKAYRVVFYCSTTVVDRLLGNAGYPSIVADYEKSFPILRELPCDVFLAPHPAQWGMLEKRERAAAGGNPFVDPTELRRYVDQSEKQFREALAKEKAAAAPAAAPK